MGNSRLRGDWVYSFKSKSPAALEVPLRERFVVTFTRSWAPDGSAQDLWDEDYAVINLRGEEVFLTFPSRIEAERWIRAETARFFSGALNPF
jgi:hypothetical protein